MAKPCKDCNCIVHGFNNTMVMLKDSLWRSICDHPRDVICVECIIKRLKRPITSIDLKPNVPCNSAYLNSL